jgi:phage shock protein C
MSKRLYRSTEDKMIAGVCGGIAEYFSVDPVIIRIVFVILLLPGWLPGFIPYIIMWIIVPQKPVNTPPRQV